MNISLNWLKDYIDLDGISLNEILDKLTIIGLEVEEVINQRASFNKIIVGYVKEKGKHPNADKLSVCKVEDGKNVYDVVCGAPNVEKGQKVVFAQIGAIIPNGGFEIRKAKIRGEKSEGMICSESELEISENHDGIMVLDESAQVGQNISEYFGLDDVIIDVAITPNRSDALSHIGIARDLAAVFGKDVKLPKIT
ncbi:MAG: phenylalanine--tRNA ligase subunit beta, partial [Melioribacteraceae bacterium]|nr:phenylalanine--tRNA ligase subunit beta [Melioribacteraceae bacterium]